MVTPKQLKKKSGEVYCAELGAIRSSKIRLNSQRRDCIKVTGKLTRCMVLVVFGGHPAKFTSVIGLLMLKMESVSFHSKAVMTLQVNFKWIKGRATVTTSGLIIEGTRAGGTRTNNMALEFTSPRIPQVSSLGFGRWASELSGSQMLRATKSEWVNLTTLNFSLLSI